jgi:transcriptional regulator with XRE-family HTH domain
MDETATATSGGAPAADGGAAAVRPAGGRQRIAAVPHVIPKIEITEAARDVLDAAEVNGHRIRLPAPDDMDADPDPDAFAEADRALRTAGGRWRGGKISAYVFAGDAAEVLSKLRGKRGKRKSNRGVYGFRPEALIIWRKSRGWEQKELAERAGLSPGGLSHIESGKRRPSMPSLVKLCRVLTIGDGTDEEPDLGPRGVCNPEDLIDLPQLAEAEPGMLQQLAAAAAAREAAAAQTAPPRTPVAVA